MAFNPMCGLRRHSNADITTKTSLSFGEHAAVSGMCSICTMCCACEIGKKATTGRTQFPQPFGTAQFGAEKRIPSLQDIQILPELFGKGFFFTDVDVETEIGGFRSKLPISLAALGSTKVAFDKDALLSEGAAKAGIVRVLGENVYITYGKDRFERSIKYYKAKQLEGYGGFVVQINANEHRLGLAKIAAKLGADGLEVKLGQGAKQGLGGEIQFSEPELAKRFEKAGYRIIKKDKGVFERHASPGTLSEENLRDLLNEYATYDLPIWIKIGIGRGITKLIDLLEKLKRKEKIPIKCLTVDGHGGGTGMSPWLIMNEFSVASAALFGVLKSRPSFDILLAGGFANGIDIAKAMLLGANGASLGRALLIAASKKNGIELFCKALSEELRMTSTILRADSITKIIGRKENLCALNSSAAAIFGLRPLKALL